MVLVNDEGGRFPAPFVFAPRYARQAEPGGVVPALGSTSAAEKVPAVAIERRMIGSVHGSGLYRMGVNPTFDVFGLVAKAPAAQNFSDINNHSRFFCRPKQVRIEPFWPQPLARNPVGGKRCAKSGGNESHA